MGEIGVSHYMAVGAVMFVSGVLCMATKRNALGVLMGIELVLNGANVNFVAFGSPYLREQSLGLDGQFIALFVIVLAAAEAAVALATGTALGDVAGTVLFDSPGGNQMTSILLAPIPVSQDNLQVVLDAEWIDQDTLCQGVPAGSVDVCG